MKYTITDKLKIAKEHVDDKVPIFEVARKYNYDVTHIKYLCSLYRMYGKKAFEDHGTDRTYTREEKLKAINRVLNLHESRRQVALSMMLINPKTVDDWVNKYKTKGESSIKDTYSRSHYVTNEERLRIDAEKKVIDRLEYLEAENEYLKKLYALIQKEQRSKKK